MRNHQSMAAPWIPAATAGDGTTLIGPAATRKASWISAACGNMSRIHDATGLAVSLSSYVNADMDGSVRPTTDKNPVVLGAERPLFDA
jgi:hypothetical protein